MRRISVNARSAHDAASTDEIEVVLIQIEHPQLAAPVRLSTDPTERISVDPLTYAGLGVPVLALVEPESRLAQGLEGAGVGLAAQSPTPEGIADALTALLADLPDSAHVRHWYAQTADRQIVLARWREMMWGLA